MKALKAKRASLRSFLRRGLVVLSILALALAFAACGNGNNGGDNGGPGQPPPPPPPPPPPAPLTAMSIAILTPPDVNNLQFEAMPPDLTGTVLSVEWSNGDRQTVTNMGDFFTVPSHIATLGDNVFRIAHRGSTVTSGEFTLGAATTTDGARNVIIPLTNVNLVKTGSVVWFNDAPPDFTNLVLQGTWEWHSGNTRLATPTNMSRTVAIPMSPTFPEFDISRAPTDGTIRTTLSEGRDPDLVAAFTPMGPGAFDLSISLDAFHEVMAVEFLGANAATFFLFDDHFMTQFASPTDGPGSLTAANETTVLNLFANSDAQFRVIYRGGETRPITWNEFVGNWNFHWQLHYGFDHEPFTRYRVLVGDDGIRQDGALTRGLLGPFPVREDEDGNRVWRVVLEYVPVRYNDQAWITMFPVDIPVAEFEGEITVTRRPGTGTANIWAHATNTDTGMTLGLRNAINDFYVLTASYLRGATPIERPISWANATFSDAGGAAVFGGRARTPGSVLLWNTAINNASPTDAIFDDFSIHVWYRNVVLAGDEEEGILIDLRWATPTN